MCQSPNHVSACMCIASRTEFCDSLLNVTPTNPRPQSCFSSMLCRSPSTYGPKSYSKLPNGFVPGWQAMSLESASKQSLFTAISNSRWTAPTSTARCPRSKAAAKGLRSFSMSSTAAGQCARRQNCWKTSDRFPGPLDVDLRPRSRRPLGLSCRKRWKRGAVAEHRGDLAVLAICTRTSRGRRHGCLISVSRYEPACAYCCVVTRGMLVGPKDEVRAKGTEMGTHYLATAEATQSSNRAGSGDHITAPSGLQDRT